MATKVTANELALGAVTASTATDETRTLTSYDNLATVGPAPSVTVGQSGMVLVILQTRMYNSSGAATNFMSYAMSGANTSSATDSKAVAANTGGANAQTSGSAVFLLTGLTAGSTTFTAKYRTDTGTAHWLERNITLIPIG